MKAFPLLAAVVPAVIAGFANTEQNSTTTVGQTITRTATTVYYVTVKPGPVTGDGMACSASGCPIGGTDHPGMESQVVADTERSLHYLVFQCHQDCIRDLETDKYYYECHH